MGEMVEEFYKYLDGKEDNKDNRLRFLNRVSCGVRVWKYVGGERVSFCKDVSFAEFYNSKNPKWLTMPFNQFCVVAEKHSLRQGFATETHGLFVEEEMGAMADLQEVKIEELDGGLSPEEREDVSLKISRCNTLKELTQLYKEDPRYKTDMEVFKEFEVMRRDLTPKKRLT